MTKLFAKVHWKTVYTFCIEISHSLDTELTEPDHKRVKLSIDETYLWHLRLGHINLNRIKRLVSDGPLSDLKVTTNL